MRKRPAAGQSKSIWITPRLYTQQQHLCFGTKELIMSKISATKSGAYALGCAITCSSFMAPAYAHANADITPYSEDGGFHLEEDLRAQLNAIAFDETRGSALDNTKSISAGTGTSAEQSIVDQLADMAEELKLQREQIATQNLIIAKQQLALARPIHDRVAWGVGLHPLTLAA